MGPPSRPVKCASLRRRHNGACTHIIDLEARNLMRLGQLFRVPLFGPGP